MMYTASLSPFNILYQGAPKPTSDCLGQVENLVWTRKPFIWLVCGQPHFPSEKNTETVENRLHSHI